MGGILSFAVVLGISAFMPFTVNASEVVSTEQEVLSEEGIESKSSGIQENELDVQEMTEQTDIFDGQNTLIWKFQKDEQKKEVAITQYIGTAANVVIPGKVSLDSEEYQVVLGCDGSNVFGQCRFTENNSTNTTLKTVKFEEGVKAYKGAGNSMFSDCKRLEKISNIPAGIEDCTNMFQHCSNLKKAPEIPEGVTNCSFMFSGCSNLTEAPEIPQSVKNCQLMFQGCQNLTKAPSVLYEGMDCGGMFNACTKLSGSMKVLGKINPYYLTWQVLGGKIDMFNAAATEGDGFTIYYADGVNIDEILAAKSENSKITAKALSEKPAPAPSNPTPSGAKVATYGNDTFYQGEDGNLRCYENGKLVTDEFKFDGTYTYYMQADGTPMKDRLTYHPDGEHIIYLDENGHEAFTSFVYCPSVDYICYFDSQGYLYKDQITFVGDKAYYLNANGAMEQKGWFQFANGLDYGYANGDGTLITTGFSCDPYGRTVFYHWNGMVARGLISDGVYYYNMDTTDGHYLGQFPVQ